MSRVCQVTGKKPVSGNNVSHANNRTRRRFLPNLHTHKFWVESENRWVKLRLSAKGMRIIDKNGIDAVIADAQFPVPLQGLPQGLAVVVGGQSQAAFDGLPDARLQPGIQ